MRRIPFLVVASAALFGGSCGKKPAPVAPPDPASPTIPAVPPQPTTPIPQSTTPAQVRRTPESILDEFFAKQAKADAKRPEFAAFAGKWAAQFLSGRFGEASIDPKSKFEFAIAREGSEWALRVEAPGARPRTLSAEAGGFLAKSAHGDPDLQLKVAPNGELDGLMTIPGPTPARITFHAKRIP